MMLRYCEQWTYIYIYIYANARFGKKRLKSSRLGDRERERETEKKRAKKRWYRICAFGHGDVLLVSMMRKKMKKKQR